MQVLSLEGALIGDSGAVALANALTLSSTVINVDIRSCLPTHRSCKHSSLSPEEIASDGADPEKITKIGLIALKGAITERKKEVGGSLRIIGDVDFDKLS